MALKVIGAGFGRTGTLSMKAALERLGYVKCHHMVEVFASANQMRMWDEIGQGARIVFITHRARERDLQATLHDLRDLDAVRQVGSVLRVIESN